MNNCDIIICSVLFNEVKILQKKITKKTSKDKGKRNKHIKTKNKVETKKNKTEIPETPSTRKSEIIGIVFVAIGLISICGLLGLNVGYMGLFFAKCLKYFFGIGAAVVSLLFVVRSRVRQSWATSSAICRSFCRN